MPRCPPAPLHHRGVELLPGAVPPSSQQRLPSCARAVSLCPPSQPAFRNAPFWRGRSRLGGPGCRRCVREDGARLPVRAEVCTRGLGMLWLRGGGGRARGWLAAGGIVPLLPLWGKGAGGVPRWGSLCAQHRQISVPSVWLCSTRGQSRGTAGPARAFACCTSPTVVDKQLPAAACSPSQPVAPRFLNPPILSPDSCFCCLTLHHMESSSFCGFADLLPDPLRD